MSEKVNFNTHQAMRYLANQGTPFIFKTLTVWRSIGGGPKFKRVAGHVFYEKDALDEFIRGEVSNE